MVNTLGYMAIPEELRRTPHWVLWHSVLKEGKLRKIPFTVHLDQAKSTRRDTWTTFDRVIQALPLALEDWGDEYPCGIGFVFSADDPYCGIDLDHCRDPETHIIEPWALDIIERLNTYTEISPSGTGVHCIARSPHPGDLKRKGRVEIYTEGRYFTMTGEVLVALPIADCTTALAAIYAEIFPPKTPKSVSVSLPTSLSSVEIFQKASAARNGGKFRVLYSGDTTGYSSPSEADFAFCCMLAFWTQDATVIDAMHRESGLSRDKWDTPRGTSTYGADTIAKALDATTTHYTGKARKVRGMLRHSPSDDDSAAFPLPQLEQSKDWTSTLLFSSTGELRETVSNVLAILRNHHAFAGLWWYDSVRGIPMMGTEPLRDSLVTCIGHQLGELMRLGIHSLGNLERCIIALCEAHPRDLLHEALNALPPWDGVKRLDYWLSDVADVSRDLYGMAVSRILPLSMIARALEPGCLYRYVVILEGPENTGKSSLVRALAGPEWYVELSIGLENKESHMMLQGAWVAEMAELDALSRTEETRLKAFLTMRDDQWIPKYSNFRQSSPRRTILVGTTNDSAYLKGQTGNTRYLPVRTGVIDVEMFCAMREQLLAEALAVYLTAPATWWHISDDAMEQATEERERRRVENVYEDDLSAYLAGRTQVTWQEIARQYLQLDKSRWSDKSIQAQIAQALKALGWTRASSYTPLNDGGRARYWMAPR